MSQDHHIVALSLAHWADPPSAETTRRDPHDLAEKFVRPFFFPGVNEGKPHRLCPAKKIAAFLTLPCPREASGLLSEAVRSLSQRPRAGLTSGRRADAFGPTCSALTAQPLKSDAACRHGGPLVVAMRTASRRNSSVYLVAIPCLCHSKHCAKETGTKTRRDQTAETSLWQGRATRNLWGVTPAATPLWRL